MKTTLNLADFTYAQARESILGGGVVGFVDRAAGIERDVELTETHRIKDFSASPFRYFEAEGVVVSLGEELCTIRLDEGERVSMAYAAYRDEAKNAEATEFYAANMNGLASTGGKNIRVELPATQNSPDDTVEVPAGTVKHPAGGPSEPDNRGNIIMLHLLKEKGSNVMDHEREWQIDDLCASLNIISDWTALGLYREGKCAYEGGSDSLTSLENFRTWAKQNQHLAGVDIFFLIRWGGWNDGILGRAYVDGYDVNEYYNDRAFGISATSCIYPRVLAHEMGHILGAVHVDDRRDVMHPNTGTTNQHRDKTNRDKIWTNGFYRG